MKCDEIIRMVLLAGLSDRDVKRELLADESFRVNIRRANNLNSRNHGTSTEITE